jgi:hypothetical protein
MTTTVPTIDVVHNTMPFILTPLAIPAAIRLSRGESPSDSVRPYHAYDIGAAACSTKVGNVSKKWTWTLTAAW